MKGKTIEQEREQTLQGNSCVYTKAYPTGTPKVLVESLRIRAKYFMDSDFQKKHCRSFTF